MKRLLLWLMMAGGAAAAPGLDAPQAIGAFLNGVFPSTTPGPTGSWSVADAFPGVTFVDPVRMVKDPTSAAHVYVVCRSGEIWRMPFSPTATNADKVRVLDRRANTWGYWDSGMLSISFHPEFGKPGSPNRGYAYVFYQYLPQQNGNTTPDAPSYMRLSRFTMPDGSQVFDPGSELVMINQFDRHNWHSGGMSFFGPEGFLYLILGDEGGSNDQFNVGQKFNNRLFSGILRIDVDRDPARSHPIRHQPLQITMPAGWEPSYTQGYYIPNDNPWQDPDSLYNVLEEFWTIGTRSPHSMTFDDETGEIWIAEVGQGTREEITIARWAGNHQWPYKEGFANGPNSKPSSIIGYEVPPIYDYPRSMGGCVIGGMVYRGSTHLGTLGGKYIFGDHNSKALYVLNRTEGQPVTAQYLASVNRSGGIKRGLAGISEGPDREPYFMELGDTGTDTGKILKLVRNGTPVSDPPRFLSQTGAFTNLATLTPRAGLIPYDVNSPLWSDGAEKRRWIAIPNNGTHDTPAEQVTYRETGAWDFPPGTVLVKHFAMPVDERNPTIIKPLETRFFIRATDGSFYGVTYRWNEAGTDAELLADGASRDYTITDAQGSTTTRRWDFPSRSDCRTCHTTNADNVLGVRSHQINGNTFYQNSGRSANQLETWNHLGIFGSSFGARDPAALPRSVNPMDPHASLDHRARSYLDANCSHCHHPDGVSANFNASFNTPLATQGIVNGLINRPLNNVDERVVKPGDPTLSLMHLRPSLVGGAQMPPLGKNVVDEKGVALIEDWIRSMNPASFDFTFNAASGIEAEYFNGRNFETRVLNRIDPTINFNWGSGSPASGIGSDSFSVRWTARLVPPLTGGYTFHAGTDDGVRVTIGGVRVINALVDQGSGEYAGSIFLTGGKPVDLVVEYYENTGSAKANLSWTPPGQPKQTVPATAFLIPSSGNLAPVTANDASPAPHRSDAQLDVLDNDTDVNAPPGIHGVAIITPPQHGSVRISGTDKRIIYTHDGSTARSDSFTYTITDPQGNVSDPATVNLTIPYDFAIWAAQTPGATGNPSSNSDGDLSPDLMEYALGGLPDSGVSPAPDSIGIEANGADITLVIRRPAGLGGVTYAVETSPDLADWQDAGAPALTASANGMETLRLSALQNRPGLSADAGFARLRVRRDGSPDNAATLPLGWRSVEFTGSRTFGMPFRETPLFSSVVVSTSGLQLGVRGTPTVAPDFRGFVEVVSGPFNGERFALASVSANTLVLATSGHTMAVPDLTGSRIVLCAHHTLGGLFDKTLFKGSTNPAAADQVQIYQNDGSGPGRFDLYYLLDARPGNPTHQWRAFLPGGGNQDTRPIVPGQGVFVKRPSGAPFVRKLLTGQVRANPFAQPLQPGVNLASSPFPLPLTPRQRGLLAPAAAFTASTNLNAADQFHLHQSGAFRIFYLLDHPSQPDFWREAVPSSANTNDTPLFAPTEAVFLKRSTASPFHSVPLPWNP